MAHSKHFKWRYLDPKNFKFHVVNQKCQIRNCQFGTFDSLHGIWNFLGPNTFIWSLLNVPLVNFFKNVSQFLPNPGFRSIQVKKCLFSKGHIFGIFILVSFNTCKNSGSCHLNERSGRESFLKYFIQTLSIAVYTSLSGLQDLTIDYYVHAYSLKSWGSKASPSANNSFKRLQN